MSVSCLSISYVYVNEKHISEEKNLNEWKFDMAPAIFF